MSKRQPLDVPLRFANKLVVITGSGTGIGQAIARRFAREGASLVILGRRKEPLEQTSNILREIISSVGSNATVSIYSGLDVSDETGIASMFGNLKDKFGKVDFVINNAGVSGPVSTFTNATVKDFRDCVTIHLTGTFWTTNCALRAMEPGGTIVTISTFFSEENRYEQRPYRFRTPYTASQGAKNRLSEALAWELAEKGIYSIATNPGPVHSDRIYKTVYPKAAAEFLRIGGFPGLSSREIEKIASDALPLLGENEDTVSNGVKSVAASIAKTRGDDSSGGVTELTKIVSAALDKIQEIAEKIQHNTSKMIVDGEFLTQDDVAEMVANLCHSNIAKLINGRVIPNDRVFYPVKPAVGTAVAGSDAQDLEGKVIILSISSSAQKDVDRVRELARYLNSKGVKQVIVIFQNQADQAHYEGFHSHAVDLTSENSVNRIFRIATSKFGHLDALVHFTGDYDYGKALASLSRSEWDALVTNFVYIPGLLTKESVNAMAPESALHEPSLYKGTNGRVVIVGPDAPVGKKISGELRARADVFRGALRPFTATVNQELADVLGSNIRLFLVLPGNTDGAVPNSERLVASVAKLIGSKEQKANESIFYIDESR